MSRVHHPQNTVIPAPPPIPTLSKLTSLPVSHTTPTARSSKQCSNCGRSGHWVTTCFESGGGMEGHQAEFWRDKHKVVAMLLASLEDSCGSEADEH